MAQHGLGPMLTPDYVGLYLAFPNPDGSAVQKIWLVSRRVADRLQDQLGVPHGTIELPPGAAQAAGEAAVALGADADLNPRREPR